VCEPFTGQKLKRKRIALSRLKNPRYGNLGVAAARSLYDTADEAFSGLFRKRFQVERLDSGDTPVRDELSRCGDNSKLRWAPSQDEEQSGTRQFSSYDM